MGLHKNITGDDNHVNHTWTYADAAARAAATGFVAADVGKDAFQQDNRTFWRLTNHSPITWVDITAGGGGGGDELVKVSGDDTTAGYLNGKLTAAAPITLTEQNPGANETLQVGLGAVNHGDLGGVTSDQHHAQQHDLSGADHNSTTLAGLNAKITDANLDDSGASRPPTAHGAAAHTGTIGAHSQLSGVGADDHHAHANKTQIDLITDGDHDVRTDNPHSTTAAQAGAAPTPHALGGADHGTDTLASLNAKISDANLDDSGASRPPTAHGSAAHTGTIGAHSQLSGVGADDHHTHANKAEIDLVTDGDHDVRTDNPHGVTAAQAGAASSPHAIDGAEHTGQLDHGGLAGLADVADHPGYLDLAGTRQMTGSLQMNSQDIRSAKAADFGSGVSLGSLGATPTINWTGGNKQKGTLSANAVITFVAPNGWGNLMLELVQDGTGGRSVTFPAAVLWGGGTAPDFSSMSAGEIALVALFYDGTNYLAEARLGYS